MDFKILLRLFSVIFLEVICCDAIGQSRDWFYNPFAPTPETQPAPKFKPCSPLPPYGEMTNVIVTPCIGTGACPLVRGTNVSLDLEFVSKVPATGIILTFSGVYGWFTTPFAATEKMCMTNGRMGEITCPLVPGAPYKYRRTVYIEPRYPKLSVNVKASVLDENSGIAIACAMIPVEIQ